MYYAICKMRYVGNSLLLLPCSVMIKYESKFENNFGGSNIVVAYPPSRPDKIPNTSTRNTIQCIINV